MGEKIVAIIGGGKFGLQALQWALKNHCRAIVFDSNSDAPVRKHIHAILSPDKGWTRSDFTQSPSVLVIGDALEISYPILQEIRPAFLIPTIPVHFLAAVLLFVARATGVAYQPDADAITRLTTQFTAPLNTCSKPTDGILTLSYAQPGEICPPQCAGPKDSCPTFRRKKEKTVTQLVADAMRNFPSAFLAESEQLTKGLGGIPGAVFFEILERFKANLPLEFLVATTCNCHGVVNAFKCGSTTQTFT